MTENPEISQAVVAAGIRTNYHDVGQGPRMRENCLTALNEQTRFVRVTSEARGGFIEFQFSIGDPTLYLEMILPKPAFEEFCGTNQVVHLNAEQGRMVDADYAKWRDGETRP